MLRIARNLDAQGAGESGFVLFWCLGDPGKGAVFVGGAGFSM